MEPKEVTTVSATPRQAWQDTLPVLVSLLDMSRGQFTLVFVSYERPSQRQRIVTALRHALPHWIFAPVSLQDTALDLRNLPGHFFDTLQEIAQRDTQTYDAILLLDWDQRLVPDQPLERQPSTSLLGVFNMGRHLLAQTFACPCIVLVPQWAMMMLLQLAPDFVSWQSGDFFVPFDVVEIVAEMRAAVAAAPTAQPKDTAGVAERLETCLRDVLEEGEQGFPVDLVAEALAQVGELHLRLGNPQRAETHFAQLEVWSQQHGLKQWQRRARRGRRQAVRQKLRPQPSQETSAAIAWDIFRGAAAIVEEDRVYGREEDLNQIIELVIDPTFRCGTLWGETGCGKTSLVRAGLVPALRRQGYLPVYINRYDDPEADIAHVVAEAAGLRKPELSLAETLRSVTQETGQTIIFLCDQFEQVFTSPATRDHQKCAAFLRCLSDCVNDLTLPVRCLLLVRADHLYCLTEFDTLTPSDHPLDQERRYELRWLLQADAARVLRRMRDEARAVWPEDLINAVVTDLASDGRIKPVHLQLVAAGLYLRQVNTLDTYIELGGVDGLLKDYLTAVFDTLPRPDLARSVVHSLVLPAQPPVRLLRSAGDIAAEVHALESEVQAILDGLQRSHVVQVRTESTSVAYDLVHDVLTEPALQSTTAQEIGLSIIRSALARRRRRLSRKEYRTAARSDVTELPESQQLAARRLLRRTFYMLRSMEAVCIGVSLFILVTVLQFTAVHIRIEPEPPEPLVARRGLQRLDFLPSFLGPQSLFDTGLTVHDIPSYKRASLEAMLLRPWDGPTSTGVRQLSEHLGSAAAVRWLFYTGNWQEGLRRFGDTWKTGPYETPERVLRRVLREVVQVLPESAVPALITLLSEDTRPSIRAMTVLALGQIGWSQATTVVPVLLPLLRETDRSIWWAVVEALGQVGGAQAETVVPVLLPLLRETDERVRQAAVEALGQGDAQAGTVVPALLPLLRDTSLGIPAAVARALGQVGGGTGRDGGTRLATFTVGYDLGRPDGSGSGTRPGGGGTGRDSGARLAALVSVGELGRRCGSG